MRIEYCAKLYTVTQLCAIISFHLIFFNVGLCGRVIKKNKRKKAPNISLMRKSFTRKQSRGGKKGIFEETKVLLKVVMSLYAKR